MKIFRFKDWNIFWKTMSISVGTIVIFMLGTFFYFGMSGAERTRDTCIIVTEVELDGENAVIGIRVDAVLEVLELDEGEIAPPPRIGTKLKTEFIRGMGDRNGGFLIILDIDRIFSSEEIALVRQAGEGPA